jgi:hypothetical protein
MSRKTGTLALAEDLVGVLYVPKGEQYTYTVPAFDEGTVLVEESENGIEFAIAVTVAAAGATATRRNSRNGPIRVRLRAGEDYVDAGGTAVQLDDVAGDSVRESWQNGQGETVAQVTDEGFRARAVRIIDELGVADTDPTIEAIAGLTVEHRDFGPLRRTVLRLSDVPVSCVSVTTGRGVGGTKLMTLPQSMQNFLGCTADLTVRVAAAEQADLTDGTPEGDVGIGTLAPANADALGTDATDDDFATAQPFTMADFAGPADLPVSEAARVLNGNAAGIPVFLNAAIDAADIDDGATAIILFSGTVVFTWIPLA